MGTQIVNATLDCIQTTITFSGKIITNVCTGMVTKLPLGLEEIIIYPILSALLVLLVFLIIGGTIAFVREIF